MPLFTDGPPSCIEDLSAQDSQLLNIANVEGIDVTQKLRLAHEEIGIHLFSLLSPAQGVDQAFWLEPKAKLGMVVATPALKLWHTYRALEMFYADAYNSQMNDRYAGRRDQFQRLAQWAHEKLVQIGLGMVTAPVPQAAPPTVTGTTGGPLADGTYYATMAWVNRAGEEGAAAHPVDITTAGNTILVTPSEAPAEAASWNVFVGSDPGALVQQNGSPIDPGETWVQFAPPAVAGRKPGQGQAPNYRHAIPRMLQRG
jgi:hypothetical protein